MGGEFPGYSQFRVVFKVSPVGKFGIVLRNYSNPFLKHHRHTIMSRSVFVPLF